MWQASMGLAERFEIIVECCECFSALEGFMIETDPGNGSLIRNQIVCYFYSFYFMFLLWLTLTSIIINKRNQVQNENYLHMIDLF